MNTQIVRRSRLSIAVAAVAAVALAGCGSAGRSQQSPSTATMWSLSSGDQPVIEAAVDRWNNSNPDQQIKVEFFATDAYKAKIRTAVGADQAPTLIFNWSGGVLQSYVDAGAVEDLTGWLNENPEVADRYIPSVAENGVIDGRTYAIPMTKTNPATMYYNTDLLKQAGVEIPKTWDDLLAAIPKLKDIGVDPIALGGQSMWPELIWLEYLVNRQGGPEVWDGILAGEEDAWSDPAVLDALKKIQELVEAGAFQDSFASTASNSGSELALLYTGRAAINLQISSQYQVVKQAAPDFVSEGTLGFAPFPTIDGGAGDPSMVVGSPSTYFSVSSHATDAQQATAKEFLAEGLFDEEYTQDVIDTGAVPALNGIETELKDSDDAPFLEYTHSLASDASEFQLSWDQALPPAASDTLLSTLSQVFLNQITPEEFVATMNEVSVE
ncbi:MAG: extracellular solute-binding protein [Actinomycetota bacterium]|nr:extracellular solute-binding protein [Actinomycetota bacterium]